MYNKLLEYYGDERFYLPGHHFNCAAHELMGGWIAEELLQRNMV